jgi:hypothetical protein
MIDDDMEQAPEEGTACTPVPTQMSNWQSDHSQEASTTAWVPY